MGDKAGGLFGWNLEDGSRPVRLAQGKLPAPITCAAVCGTGAGGAATPLLAVGCADASVHLLDWGQEGGSPQLLVRHSGDVQALVWTPLCGGEQAGGASAGAGEEAAGPGDGGSPPAGAAPLGPDAARGGLLASCASDGRVMVHSLRRPGGSGSSDGGGLVAVQAQRLCTLTLPTPPRGLTQSQRTRLWLTAAWAPAERGSRGDGRWLVTSAYGGAPPPCLAPCLTPCLAVGGLRLARGLGVPASPPRPLGPAPWPPQAACLHGKSPWRQTRGRRRRSSCPQATAAPSFPSTPRLLPSRRPPGPQRTRTAPPLPRMERRQAAPPQEGCCRC